jgi:hypothetical protein
MGDGTIPGVENLPDAANDPSYSDDGMQCGSYDYDDDNNCPIIYNLLMDWRSEIVAENIMFPGSGRLVAVMHQWNESAIAYNRACSLKYRTIYDFYFFNISPTPIK